MFTSVYGWPAGAVSFDIKFYDFILRTTAIVQTAYRQNSISYAAPESTPGLLIIYPNYTIGVGKPYVFPLNQAPSLSSLRWMVRDAVNDVAEEDGVDIQYPTAPKWPDREIDNYIRQAISYLNRYGQAEDVIETTLDLYTDHLIRGVTTIVDVAFYNDASLEWINLQRFSRRGHRGVDRYWDINNGRLTLYGRFPDNAKLELRVQVPYNVPANDTQLLDVTEQDWDILSLYSQAACYLRLAGQSAQLDRWKEQGKRNDNPITPVARLLLDQVHDRIYTQHGPRAIRRFRA